MSILFVQYVALLEGVGSMEVCPYRDLIKASQFHSHVIIGANGNVDLLAKVGVVATVVIWECSSISGSVIPIVCSGSLAQFCFYLIFWSRSVSS